MSKYRLHETRDLGVILYAGSELHTRAYIDNLGADLRDDLGNGLGGETSGKHHGVTGQLFPGSLGEGDRKRHPGPAQSRRMTGLNQNSIGRKPGSHQGTEVRWRRDSHDAPDQEPG